MALGSISAPSRSASSLKRRRVPLPEMKGPQFIVRPRKTFAAAVSSGTIDLSW